MAQPIDIDEIITASVSETGPRRSENQDLFADLRHASGGRLLIVADGMGGHRGGAQASRTCVDALLGIFEDPTGSPDTWLRSSFEAANEQIHEATQASPELKHMGTTGVALLFAPDGTAWAGWVGDSRLYRLRDGELERLTDDHSLVAEWVTMGVLSPEEAAVHPRRNELTRAIGIAPDVEVEIRSVEVQRGDRFMLCSDGLHGVLDEARICETLAAEPPHAAARSLVDLAVGLGGPDNITVLIAAMGAADEVRPAPPTTPVPPLPRAFRIIPPIMELPPEASANSGRVRVHAPSMLTGAALAALVAAGVHIWPLAPAEPDPVPATTRSAAIPREVKETQPTAAKPLAIAAVPGPQRPASPDPVAVVVATRTREPEPPAAVPVAVPTPPAAAVPAPAGPLPEPVVVEPTPDAVEKAAIVRALSAHAAADPTPAAPEPAEEAEGIYIPAPIPVPTAEGLGLPDAVRSFVDAWMRAGADRDYAAYHALGFPEDRSTFKRTYGQWEALRLAVVEVDEGRATDERVYLRLVLSYAFHEAGGRWRTEDEHRLLLRATDEGLRYEARWK